MKTTSRVINEPEISSWLKGLSTTISELVLVNAAQAGAMPITTGAKEKAPKKTRTLARSIHAEIVKSSPKYVEIAIGTNLEYASIQEFGGVVKPKQTKFLAIPVSDVARQYVSPRNFPMELTFIPGPGGGVLVEGETIHYVLRRSVTIPAHPYLRPSMAENEDRAVSNVGQALKAQMDRY